MLTRQILDDYIATNGPYLYHRAPADALPLIFAQGLLPWDHEHRTDVDELGEASTTSYDSSRMLPRSDRVYLGVPAYVRHYDGVTIRIDLRELDPLMIDCDEDHVDYVRHPVPDWIRERLPEPPREWGSWEKFNEPDCADCDAVGCEECGFTGLDPYADPRDEISLGDWADEHATLIDTPEIVAFSLDSGSIAVRSGIPAVALSLDIAKLASRDLQAISRAFDAPVEVAPFTVQHGGVELLVRLAPDGAIVEPPTLPDDAWKIHQLAAELRGAAIAERLNEGRTLQIAPSVPTLLPLNDPAPVRWGSPNAPAAVELA